MAPDQPKLLVVDVQSGPERSTITLSGERLCRFTDDDLRGDGVHHRFPDGRLLNVRLLTAAGPILLELDGVPLPESHGDVGFQVSKVVTHGGAYLAGRFVVVVLPWSQGEPVVYSLLVQTAVLALLFAVSRRRRPDVFLGLAAVMLVFEAVILCWNMFSQPAVFLGLMLGVHLTVLLRTLLAAQSARASRAAPARS